MSLYCELRNKSGCSWRVKTEMFHVFFFLCFIIFCKIQTTILYRIENTKDALNYLERLGYAKYSDPAVVGNRAKVFLSNKSRKENGDHTTSNDREFREAIWNYQLFYGLVPSGILDNPTMTMMNRARCGNPDHFSNIVGAPRRKRFSLSPFKWRKNILSYRVMDYPDEPLADFLPKVIVDNEIKFAFSLWSPAANLTFVKRDVGPVDIEIRFVERSHGDSASFEGPGLMLAHAFFPDPDSPFEGDIHFDAEEPWTLGIPKTDEFHFRWVAIHEIGHALGIEHSQLEDAYMFAMYPSTPYDPRKPLHSDDIQGAQVLYDAQTVGRSAPMKMNSENRPPTPRLRNVNEFTRGRPPTVARNPFSENRSMICKINSGVATLSSFLKSLHICVPTEYFQ